MTTITRSETEVAVQCETEVAVEKARRDHRIAVFETIGSAMAVLRRLDHAWYDEDVRAVITHVRSTLSVQQSKIKERIDE